MKIIISENNVWAGTGNLRDGIIQDCPAILGDGQDMAERAYQAIEDAIRNGEDSTEIDDYTWTWELEAEDEDRYLVRVIDNPGNDDISALSQLLYVADEYSDAKAFARETAMYYQYGVAIEDTEDEQIDWGSEWTGYDGEPQDDA